MNKFEVGDFVECVETGETSERGSGWQLGLKFSVTEVSPINNGFCCYGGVNGNGVWEDYLKLVERGKMSKYDELKQRIQNLKYGWDKNADDILDEIHHYSTTHYFPCIPLCKSGEMEIQDSSRKRVWAFAYNTQCDKLEAFKTALHWLLDQSNIKSEKQTEIDKLKEEAKKLNERIENLEKA